MFVFRWVTNCDPILLRLRYPILNEDCSSMADVKRPHKVVIVGAGPVGSLAALYAASRGDDVEMYELRGGMSTSLFGLAPSAYGILYLARDCFHDLV